MQAKSNSSGPPARQETAGGSKDRLFTVVTQPSGWSDIVGPNGYREGPYRYRWEAQEFADRLELGALAPETRS